MLKTIMLLEDSLEDFTPKQTGHVRSACFARWWRWKQRSLHAKRKQTMEDLGARAAQVLGEQGLVPDAKGLYTIQCPSCRSALACTSSREHCSCNSYAFQRPAGYAQADARGLGARPGQVPGKQGLVPDAKGLFTAQCPPVATPACHARRLKACVFCQSSFIWTHILPRPSLYSLHLLLPLCLFPTSCPFPLVLFHMGRMCLIRVLRHYTRMTTTAA